MSTAAETNLVGLRAPRVSPASSSHLLISVLGFQTHPCTGASGISLGSEFPNRHSQLLSPGPVS